MQETSSTEFEEWREFLKEELQTHTKQDRYLAQIALEVARTKAKSPKALKLSHFLIKFQTVAPFIANPKDRLAASKGAWGMFLGGAKKKKRPKK